MRLNMQVVSAGAVTSVGLSIGATTAAIRAGLDNFNDTNFMSRGTPIIGAKVTGLNKKNVNGVVVGGTEEQATWCSYAIEECISLANCAEINELLVIVINPNPAIPDLINRKKMGQYIYSASKHYCDLAEKDVKLHSINDGPTGCGHALICAQEWFVDHPRGSVLIVGADSWLNVPRIQYGLKHERILTEEKAEGFIPSEGAAAILLQVPRKGKESNNRFILKGVGLSQESAYLLTEKPCSGVGMADATREALSDAQVEVHNIHLRLANITGEEYFFDEAAMAWARLLRQPMQKNYEWQIPATKIGNIGSAYGPLLIGYAYWLNHTGRHSGNKILIQLSSQSESRAALVATKSAATKS